jgi:hypothetical protein
MVNWGRTTFAIGKIEKILLLLFAVYGKPAPTGTFISPWVNRHLHLYHGKNQVCPVLLHLGEWDPAVSVPILKHLRRRFKHLNFILGNWIENWPQNQTQRQNREPASMANWNWPLNQHPEFSFCFGAGWGGILCLALVSI